MKQSVLRSRSAALVALAGLVVLGFSSCSGDDSEEQAETYSVPQVSEVAAVNSSIRLPFDEYELPAADRVRMQAGQARLLQRCMSERGVDATFAGDYLLGGQRSGFMDPTMWGGPFGTMPLAHARRFGYKPAPDGPFVKGPGFYLSNPAHLFLETGMQEPAAVGLVEAEFYGVDEAGAAPGCQKVVESSIGAELIDFIDLRSRLNQWAREHPRVEEASRRWSVCMSRAGYDFDSVWSASQKFATVPLTQEQVDTAVADVRCTQESRWADYFYAVVADYQRQATEHESTLLEAALASEEERLVAIETELANE